MFDDLEKNRVEYVARLEASLEHATRQLEQYKAIAEHWQPICTSEMDSTNKTVRFTLKLAGKQCSVTITYDSLQTVDSTTAVTGIVDALIEGMVAEKLRGPVQEQLEKVLPAVNMAVKAGNW